MGEADTLWYLKWVKRVPVTNLHGQEVDLVVVEWFAAEPAGSGRLSKRTEWEL